MGASAVAAAAKHYSFVPGARPKDDDKSFYETEKKQHVAAQITPLGLPAFLMTTTKGAETSIFAPRAISLKMTKAPTTSLEQGQGHSTFTHATRKGGNTRGALFYDTETPGASLRGNIPCWAVISMFRWACA